MGNIEMTTTVKIVGPKTFEEAVSDVVMEISDLLVRKQKDYGHKNILEFGEFGCLVRTNDKVARLKNLSTREGLNESIDDSWKDLAGYSILALMLRRGTFTLPLKDQPSTK